MAMAGLGLVLGGGGLLCAAELGVLQALRDWGIAPAVVTGCSGGGIIAGALGAGVPLDAVTATLRIVSARPSRYGLGDVPALEDVFREGATPGLWSLQTVLEDLLLHATAETLGQWAPGYGVTATSVGAGTSVAFTAGQGALESTLAVLQATSAFPFLFQGVRAPGGDLYQDGGILDNVPAGLAVNLGADRLLAVSFAGAASAVPARLGPIDILYRSVNVAVRAAQRQPPDVPTVTLRPTLPDGAWLLSFSLFDPLVQAGYAAAVAARTDIEALVAANPTRDATWAARPT